MQEVCIWKHAEFRCQQFILMSIYLPRFCSNAIKVLYFQLSLMCFKIIISCSLQIKDVFDYHKQFWKLKAGYMHVCAYKKIYIGVRYNWTSSAYKWKIPYFWKIKPIGSVWITNGVGARIEPCGTPQDRGVVEEVFCPIHTLILWLAKKRPKPLKSSASETNTILQVWEEYIVIRSKAELRSKLQHFQNLWSIRCH